MNQTITKKKLINSISREKNVHPNDVRTIIQAFLDHMTDALAKGDRLEFRDFGVFEVVERKQKIGRNPKNAAVPIIIPSRKAVKFTPGKKMRRQVEALGENASAEKSSDQAQNTAEPMAQNPMNLSSI
jgi:integration host factor subunit beta